jgi:hypothetical protein
MAIAELRLGGRSLAGFFVFAEIAGAECTPVQEFLRFAVFL